MPVGTSTCSAGEPPGRPLTLSSQRSGSLDRAIGGLNRICDHAAMLAAFAVSPSRVCVVLVCSGLSASGGCTRAGFRPMVASDARSSTEASPRDELGSIDALPRDTAMADLASDLRGQFGPATIIAGLGDTSQTDTDPSLTADLLELYFSSEGRAGSLGSEDIWLSARASVDAPWGDPTLLGEVSSPSRDTEPVVSRDGLTLLLGSDRGRPQDGWEIWIARRVDRASTWSVPTLLEGQVNTVEDELPSSISDDGLELFVHARRSGITSLYRATRSSQTDPWGSLSRIDELSTTAFDSDGYVTGDGTLIVFDSDRSPTQGVRDLYFAIRPARGMPFGPAMPIGELNTSGNDANPWISEERCYLVFSRSPLASTGIFTRPSRIHHTRCR